MSDDSDAERSPATDSPSSAGASADPEASADGGRLLFDVRLLSVVLVSSVGVFGNQAIPPVLPSIGTGLALSDTQIGLVMSVYFFAVMLAVPVLGAFADIYGRRPVVLASLLSFGLGGVVAFLAGTFPMLLLARVLQGAALAGMTPLSVAMLGDFFEGQRGTTAQGIREASNGLSGILAPAIAGAIAVFGWQYPFLLYLAGFPVFVLAYLYLPEGVSDRRNDGGSAGESPGGDGTDPARPTLRAELWTYAVRMAHSINDRSVMMLVLGGFTLFFVRYGMLTVVPLLATRTLGMGPALVGLVLSLIGVVRVVVSPLAGGLLSYVSRRVAFAGTMCVVAAGMALLAVVPDVRSLAVALVVFATGMALFNPLLNDAVAAAGTADTRAGFVSAMQMGKNVANTVAPAAFTLVLTLADFAAVFVFATAVCLVYAGAILLVLDRTAY